MKNYLFKSILLLTVLLAVASAIGVQRVMAGARGGPALRGPQKVNRNIELDGTENPISITTATGFDHTDPWSDDFRLPNLYADVNRFPKYQSLAKDIAILSHFRNRAIFRNELLTKDFIKTIKRKGSDWRAQSIAADANIFRKLDLYEEFTDMTPAQVLDFVPNPNYCDQVDLLNLIEPENIFQNYNLLHKIYWVKLPPFLSELTNDHTDAVFPRNLGDVPAVENRELPDDVTLETFEREDLKSIYLIPKHTMFYGMLYDFDYLKAIGSPHTCITQTYGIIPGAFNLVSKDTFTGIFQQYKEKKLPKTCIEYDRFFPPSYYLQTEAMCKEFFKVLDSDEYYQGKKAGKVQYLVKIGRLAHQGNGVDVLTQVREDELRNQFANGDLCGSIDLDLVVQKYVNNPLLLYTKNKFDFRIYALIASTNPLIAYYHDGWARVSLLEYNATSQDKRDHLTNTKMSDKLVEQAPEEEKKRLLDKQLSTFKMLADDLVTKGYAPDGPDAFIELLRSKLKRSISHIFRMGLPHLQQRSGSYRLFGLDFMLDTDLNLWFIEANGYPQPIQIDPHRNNFMQLMLRDMFEIHYGYLRSRMKRIYQFVREAVQEYNLKGEAWDKLALKGKFLEINKDKMEWEYQIRPGNSWTKIIDLSGGVSEEEGYFHLDPSCFA